MKTYKVAIIEDEQDAQELLTSLIDEYCPELELIGTYASVEHATDALKHVEVDLVFLDIMLGAENSFEILDQIINRSFEIIFATAFESFAVKAFRYAAIDYLLKPYTPRDLRRAVSRFLENKRADQVVLPKTTRSCKKLLAIPDQEGFVVVKTNEIIFLEAQRAYCNIHTENGLICASRSMKDIYESLQSNDFLQVHNSYIVNKRHVIEFNKNTKNTISLSNYQCIPVARRRKNEVYQRLKTIHPEN